jgi:hypothetical protein
MHSAQCRVSSLDPFTPPAMSVVPEHEPRESERGGCQDLNHSPEARTPVGRRERFAYES